MLLVAAPLAIAAPTTPTADFTDNGDGTVTHRITGLTWMRCAMGMMWDGSTCTGTANTYTWDQAVALTATFAGKSDWRLPSIAELNTIVEREAVNPAINNPAINATVFPNAPTDSWSASASARSSITAWSVLFNVGVVGIGGKDNALQVRLVRAGQSFDPLALYTPTSDFSDNGDGTATHRKTGLMWKRCAEGQTWSGSTCSGSAAIYDWNTAVALTSSSAGYNDWRLPTAKELLTIVEYQASKPAINTTVFPNTTSYADFWSASADAYPSYSTYAYDVSFTDGSAGISGKGFAVQVRLVRAGQIFSPLGFTAQTGVEPNAAITSNALSVAGISGATPVTIVGGRYAINGGAYTTAAGTVNSNDSVTVRVAASPGASTTTRATLTIGDVSGDFSVTTTSGDNQAPSVPTNLTATAVGNDKINLTWSAASDNVGVTTYQLFRNGNRLATLGNVTSYVDAGLSVATAYTYQVVACDAGDNCSAQSAAASHTTPAAPVATTPTKDFTDNGDGTVTHKLTGLTWMRCAMGMTWTGTTCTGTANRYTLDQARVLTTTFAGKSDWRSPSIAELNSIVEREAFYPAINATMFPNTPASSFCSASDPASGVYSAQLVNFSTGLVFSNEYGGAVRLVRGGQSFDPLALYTPTADFSDNGDGTVTHRKTGLMWKRCAEGQTWSGSTCSGNGANYDWGTAVGLSSSSVGYNDWRLPTANELLTIVEYQASNPAINTTIFPNTSASNFWSASTYVFGSRDPLYVEFGTGNAFSYLTMKSFTTRVRLVRDGQIFSPVGFAAQSGVEPNAATTSNALSVTGITGATPIAILGGSYAINGGAYTTAPGTVNPNDSVTVRLTAAPSPSTTTRATLTIGGVSGDFSATTLAEPLRGPSTLTATTVSASQVDLTWSTAGDGVTGYRLYRNGVLLATVGNVTSYSDTQLSNATHFDYSVVACDAGNNCSTPSGVAAATSSGSVNTAPMLAAGANHAASLKNDGSLWMWGYNDSGQLGDGGTSGLRTSPQAVGAGFTTVVLGGSHSVAIKADGSLWAWGANASGQLGDGTNSTRNTPVQIGTGYIALAAGNTHTLGIRQDGSLWAWGNNGNGQLGDGTTNQHTFPIQIGTGFYAVAAGASHSVALKTDGSLWAWGANLYGQLGDGTGADRYIPTLIGSGFTAVAAGAFHTIALKTDGSLWSWGNNDAGQLGKNDFFGDPFNPFVPALVGIGFSAIAAGTSHSIALKTDGSVWAWGCNASGQLGDGTTVKVLGIGCRRLWTENPSSPVQVPGLSDVVAVAAGGSYSLALNSDGTVLSWGANNSGQLGDGTFAQRPSPVLVVNENVDGFLNLNSAPDFEVPPSVRIPFFVAASGGITDTSATVNLKTRFNSADVGRAGAVFVTAIVPSGSLVSSQSQPSALSAIHPVAYAAAIPSAFVLIQLTASGWQQVVNGQLIPYASGVLGDQLAAQTILDNTDTTNLKGAQFCLGYGASENQMIAAGTMRVVATIPDPNATGGSAPSCLITGPALSYNLVLPQGWSLLGNSLNQTLSVAELYGDANTVNTVWKWDPSTQGWQFYTPLMDAAGLQTYAAAKGYGVLSTIKPGEGYWVNAKSQPALSTQSGASFILTAAGLAKGWNLAATGDDITPSVFNTNLKSSLPGTGVVTLWTWDNPSTKWYFYAPSLEDQGGTALSGYIASKGYLDFSANNKTLGKGTGFWVNKQ